MERKSEYKNNSDINRLLQNVTKYVSRPLGFNKMYQDAQTQRVKKREIEYASNLPLQLVLYYNVFYAIVWAFGCIFLWPVMVNTSQRSPIWILFILFGFAAMVLFEIIRLYLGYVGNLGERVPELTGFWLLTLMVQVPLSIFLLIIVWVPLNFTGVVNNRLIFIMPMQFVLELIHAIFVFLELGLGLFALRVLARYQISRFHYKQFDAYENAKRRRSKAEQDEQDELDDWLTSLDKENTSAVKKSF